MKQKTAQGIDKSNPVPYWFPWWETEHTSFLFYHFAKGLSIPFPKSHFEKHNFVSCVQTAPPNFYVSSCKNIKNRLAIIAKV
jgi:hypothetical protein